MAVSFEDIRQQMQQAWLSDENVVQKYSIQPTDTFDSKFPNATYTAIIINIVSYITWLREQALGDWKADIDATALSTRYGTKQWWHKQALAFQDNDMTEVIDDKVGYAEIDTSKQIVKFASINEEGLTLILKVAKGEVASLRRLSTDELTRFTSYINDIKPLGIRLLCYSEDADNMNIGLNIYYDGERSQEDVQNEIKVAINNYISNIVFGGIVLKSKIIDAAQSVAGVKDVEVIEIKTKSATDVDWTIMAERDYSPTAGYANVVGWNLNLIIDN